MSGMKPINEAHVAQPSLAVVEVAACDDQTAWHRAGANLHRRLGLHPKSP
jgi:hypothetical protein